MKDWTQSICKTCFMGWCLGRDEDPKQKPHEVLDSVPADACLICGAGTRIYIRVDPVLTSGLPFARERA